MKASLWICVVLCIGGCSTLGGDRHASELADNRADDAYCIDHGLHYPDAGYVQCRRQLVDRHLYQDWRNFNQMQRAGQAATNAGTGTPPAFHRPDPARFHCRAEPQFGNDYVFCGYEGDASEPR